MSVEIARMIVDLREAAEWLDMQNPGKEVPPEILSGIRELFRKIPQHLVHGSFADEVSHGGG